MKRDGGSPQPILEKSLTSQQTKINQSADLKWSICVYWIFNIYKKTQRTVSKLHSQTNNTSNLPLISLPPSHQSSPSCLFITRTKQHLRDRAISAIRPAPASVLLRWYGLKKNYIGRTLKLWKIYANESNQTLDTQGHIEILSFWGASTHSTIKKYLVRNVQNVRHYIM